jgi:hypothetical protein
VQIPTLYASCGQGPGPLFTLSTRLSARERGNVTSTDMQVSQPRGHSTASPSPSRCFGHVHLCISSITRATHVRGGDSLCRPQSACRIKRPLLEQGGKIVLHPVIVVRVSWLSNATFDLDQVRTHSHGGPYPIRSPGYVRESWVGNIEAPMRRGCDYSGRLIRLPVYY